MNLGGVKCQTQVIGNSREIQVVVEKKKKMMMMKDDNLVLWMKSKGWGGYVKAVHIYIIMMVMIYSNNFASASIHYYANQAFVPQSDAFFFHGGSEGLYASKPHPSSSDNQPYNGDSFIRFESVYFRRTAESAKRQNPMQRRTGLIEAIVFEVKDRDNIGGVFLNTSSMCCTPQHSRDGSCIVGEIIIRKNTDNPEWPRRIQTFFEGDKLEANMDTISIEINSTGMYYLYFMFCDPQLKGAVIRGRTVWKNPHGYLPGKMAPLMTFYGIASLGYLVLGLVWFLRFLKFWKDIIQLHYHITVVIALGMCETALWYFEYANLNATGSRPVGITLWAVTITAVKKTLSRLLLLVVSMGYGVVRPTLGGVTSKVLLLGLIYFVALEALDLVQHLGTVDDISSRSLLYLVLPVAFLDAWFILWIFSSLSRTLEKLQMRRSMAKLELYRKFTNYLAVFVLLSIAWIGYELYFNASDRYNELWQYAWIIPSFWSLLAFSLLAVICILWAPSHNPTRYTYSEETGDDFDEEAIALTSGVKVIGDMTSKLERKELMKGSSSTDHIMGLDVEEDKQE